jgi:hypothetical protein
MACLLMDKRPAIAEIAGRFIFQEHVNYVELPDASGLLSVSELANL